MDLTIRDWMVIIGAGLILAVLVDAARRVYRERRSEVRLNAKITPPQGDDSDSDSNFTLLSELPNGGARIIRRNDVMQPAAADEDVSIGAGDPIIGSQRVDIPDFEQSLVSAHRRDNEAALTHDEAFADTVNPVVEPQRADNVIDPLETHASAVTQASADPFLPSDNPSSQTAGKQIQDDLVGGFSSRDEQPETLDWLDQFEPDAVPEIELDARLPRGIEPHVFVLNVVARAEAGFSGKDILHILLACDLRFGDMDFFHRHEQSAGRGLIQFSVSNMMKPGVFDIDAMSALQTKGLMFFVTLPGPEDMLKAFDYMYETAKTVARNLNGDVLDETRSAVTPQSLEHTRQQIRELERRILVQSER